MSILTQKPKGWRDGQTIWNFLQWLNLSRERFENFSGEPVCVGDGEREVRYFVSDPFNIKDEDFYNLYQQFLAEQTLKHPATVERFVKQHEESK